MMSTTKLTPQQTQEIIFKRASGDFTLRELGEEYGVSRERIRQITNMPGLKKNYPVKRCVRCFQEFINYGTPREICTTICRGEIKAVKCITCGADFFRKQNSTGHCQECYKLYRKQKMRGYLNSPHGKQKNKEWRDSHPEKQKQYSRTWYIKQDKELMKLKAAKYYRENRGRIQEYFREQHLKRKAQRLEANNKNNKNNNETQQG